MFSQAHAFVLGAVQGLTEFLPVSSSGHLVVLPWLLRWRDPGLAFDVALHIGTLLALVLYYWKDWLAMLASLGGGRPRELRLLGLLVVASVPGAVIGVLFEKQAESLFRSPLLIALAMGTLGVVLWVFDRVGGQSTTMEGLTFTDALLIGFSQALAIIPGVSRSGSTITVARILGVERESAANFSFLMATPIIAGAGIVEGRKIVQIGMSPGLFVGFGAAAIFGLAAIWMLIRFVRVRSYAAFAVYRVVAALFIISFFLARA